MISIGATWELSTNHSMSLKRKSEFVCDHTSRVGSTIASHMNRQFWLPAEYNGFYSTHKGQSSRVILVEAIA